MRNAPWLQSPAHDRLARARTSDHGALPRQGGGAPLVPDSRGAPQRARAVGLQPLQPAGGRGHHRPVHGLRHGCAVDSTDGGADAGRRVLRRVHVVLRLRGGRAGPDRLRPRAPRAPGPGRRERALLDDARARPADPVEHALRHHAREHRAERLRGARHRLRGDRRSPVGRPLQGQHRPDRARGDPDRAGARPRGSGPDDADQQRRRWAAGLDGEPRGHAQALHQARRRARDRRRALRRERVAGQPARARLRRQAPARHRARGVRHGRRLHRVS